MRESNDKQYNIVLGIANRYYHVNLQNVDLVKFKFWLKYLVRKPMV